MLSALRSPLAAIKKLRRGNLGDTIFQLLTLLFGLSVLGIIVAIFAELWLQTEASREEFGWSFVWTGAWNPVEEEFGAAFFIYGTVVTSAMAIFLAAPVGVGIAAYLVEIAPQRLNAVVGFIVETLAAVPSVVYGLWGLFVLSPWIREYIAPPLRATFGWIPLFSGTAATGSIVFTAGLVLFVMILPTVAAISRDVILAVPDSQREAMLALGATRWEMFRGAVLPYAKAGILGAVMLGLGRAAGETMAVTLIIGNAPQFFDTLFEQGATMSSIIASNFGGVSSEIFISTLLEIGMILFFVTFIINVGARLLVWAISSDPEIQE